MSKRKGQRAKRGKKLTKATRMKDSHAKVVDSAIEETERVLAKAREFDLVEEEVGRARLVKPEDHNAKRQTTSTTTSYSKHGSFPRCHESHPPVKLGNGVIYGGACAKPNEDADIYVALDSYSAGTDAGNPWKPNPKVVVYFPITDMSTPSDPAEFGRMILWLATQLEAGKKVHVGCIGGHGRTGMVLAALVKSMTDEDDAIAWVRKHYCQKAVETIGQVQFLHTHFGIKTAAPSKTHSYSGGSSKGSTWPSRSTGGSTYYNPTPGSAYGRHRSRYGYGDQWWKDDPVSSKTIVQVDPDSDDGSIWKDPEHT